MFTMGEACAQFPLGTVSIVDPESAWPLHVRDKTRQELYYVHRAASTAQYGKVQGTTRAQRS